MKTRKLFIILMLFICCFSFKSEAKEPETSKSFRHEFGVSLINLSYYHGDYIHHESNIFADFGNGLIYKYHFGNAFAIRLTTVFHHREFELPSEYNNTNRLTNYRFPDYFYIGTHKSLDMRIGLQKEFGNRKLRPFAAIDFQYVKSVENGMEHRNHGYTYVFPREFNHELQTFGAGAFLGLKYNIHLRVLLSSEIGIVYQRNFFSDWTNNPEQYNRKIVNFTNVLPGRLLNLAFKF